MKDIGKVIESKLQIKEMTQTQLGDLLGLNQRTISQYVHGKAQPSLQTFAKICNILEIDPNYILETKEFNNDDFLLEDKKEISLINYFKNSTLNDRETLLALAKILSERNK